jgi:hypothetical protein
VVAGRSGGEAWQAADAGAHLTQLIHPGLRQRAVTAQPRAQRGRRVERAISLLEAGPFGGLGAAMVEMHAHQLLPAGGRVVEQPFRREGGPAPGIGMHEERAALGQPARPGERLAEAVTRPLGGLIPKAWRPIEAATVARALLHGVRTAAPGVRVIESGDLQRLGAG